MLDPQLDENGKPKTSDGHFTPIKLPNMKKFHEKELGLEKHNRIKEESLEQDKVEESLKEREKALNKRKNARPHHDQDITPKRKTTSPRQREISFGEALAQAKSAAYNHSSISDIESKTAKVMSMIGNANNLKDARDVNQGQGQINATSANVTNNNQSVTSVSTDFLGGLRRDYQQMPSWRANIA